MVIRNSFYGLVVFIVLGGCNGPSENVDQVVVDLNRHVFQDVLQNVIDSLVNLKEDGELIHLDIYPDNIKSKYTEVFLDETRADSTNLAVKTVKELYRVLDDSVRINYELNIKYKGRKLIFDAQEVEIATRSDLVAGQVNLSNVVQLEGENLGVFYFAFQCGGMCGKGTIILSEFVDDNWVLAAIIPLWGDWSMWD